MRQAERRAATRHFRFAAVLFATPLFHADAMPMLLLSPICRTPPEPFSLYAPNY